MEQKPQKQSFVMYASFYDAAMGLNDEDFREYILGLKDYALFGIEHQSKNALVNGLLIMAQPQLEAAAIRRAKAVKNGDYGILGGRPRKGETAAEYKARKEDLRQSLNPTETLNNPEGFQTKTLNVNVDVNENENWNEKENVNVDGNDDWNVKEDVDGNAEGDEKTRISKNTNSFNANNSILTNSSVCSFKPIQEESRNQENNFQGEQLDFRSQDDYIDDDTDAADHDLPPLPDEGMMNCVGAIEELMNAVDRSEQSNMGSNNNTSTETEKRMNEFHPTKDEIARILAIERLHALADKAKILDADDEYCDGAYDIVDDNLAVIRRCFVYYTRGGSKIAESAREKINDLIMGKSPKDELEYTRILRDLWKFYWKDRAFWDAKANSAEDAYNPYRSNE